jgi:hypothetical protein
MSSLRAPTFLLAALLAAAAPSESGCGLTFCPRPEDPGSQNLEIAFAAKRTAFDIQETEGGYTELMATLQYTAFGKLALGLHAPFILLDADGTEAGFGNLVAYAEYRARPAWLNAFGAGLQAEIPMPNTSERGLGDDHYMVVPYAIFAKPFGGVMLGGALGTAFTVYGAHAEGHHHEGSGPDPIYVHPHEHFEFLYRASAGIRLAGGAFLPEAFLDGQRVIGEAETAGADLDFLAVGVSLPWVWKDISLAPNAVFPILSDARFTWSAGLTLGWKLGLGGSRLPSPGET